MGNRLEGTGWTQTTNSPVDALEGLPWVRVVDPDGTYLSSSRTEPHRLAGAYIKDALLDGEDMKAVIKRRLGLRDNAPMAPRDVALAIFRLDPLCLVHGVFFAEKGTVWPGQPKVQRALTAFIEAWDVRQAVSGGVKRDEVRFSKETGGGAAEGYGFVPFHRSTWVARRIVASFSLDHRQIASYGLPAPAGDLLTAIGRWEVRSLLDGGLRLRTACDLVPVDAAGIDAVLPPLEALDGEVRRLIGECAPLFDEARMLDVVWSDKRRAG